jgi:hypothetical protein
MKRVFLLLAFGLATSALADVRIVTVNGQIFTVLESGSIIEVTGPDGYHASGFRWGNGNVNWTINQGSCRYSPF